MSSDRNALQSAGDTRHRRDIDGLRAIAILCVLGFHAFARLLPGGFVGVDIFFVISGYLISGILLRGLERNTFSFFEFYARRIKRIFPALVLMLAVVWIIGWYAQLPDEYAHLGKHIATGAAFVANVASWREAGYFDQSADLKPLLHLWSLGVEEQFYLLWPLMLFVTWRSRISAFWMTLLVLLGSFILNLVRVNAHEAATFYLPATRFWELLVGGLYACWQQSNRPLAGMSAAATKLGLLSKIRLPETFRANLASCSGLLLIIASLLYLDGSKVFPGWWAVPPVIGSVLLIAGGPGAWVNRRLLANRAMVFIGLISYPLYLWHWPLLSFSIMFAPAGTTTVWLRLALLLAAGLLAWLTYQFVERPIRTSPALVRLAVPLAGAVAVMGAVGFLSLRGWIAPRSANYGLGNIIAAENASAFQGGHLTPVDSSSSPLRRQGINRRTVLFMGDSFVEQYYPRVDWLLTHHSADAASVVFASDGGCPPLPGVQEDHHAYCQDLVKRAVRFADDPNVSTVVIGANWMEYFLELDSRYSYYFFDGHSRQEMLPGSTGMTLALTGLRRMIEQFERQGKAVYLVLQSPDDDRFDPRRMIESRWGSASFRINTPVVTRESIARSIRPVDSALRGIAAATGAHVIDPLDYLCTRYCIAMGSDGRPVYRDGAHLNPSYVRAHVEYLDEVLLQGSGTHLPLSTQKCDPDPATPCRP